MCMRARTLQEEKYNRLLGFFMIMLKTYQPLIRRHMQVFITISFFILIFFNINKADAKPCVFCRQEIIENQSVFQSDHFNILVSYEPRVKGHLLVIPKRHLVKAHELSKEDIYGLNFMLYSQSDKSSQKFCIQISTSS